MIKSQQRTSCGCQKCQAGCRTMPGYLVPSDLAFFDINDLVASDGATVQHHDGSREMIGTIVPKQKPNGECVFFESGKCTVHEHSPFGCRMFNACDKETTLEVEISRRVGLMEIYEDDEYAKVRSQLQDARPRAERKAAFDLAIKKIERKKRKRGKR